jgi:predicted RNA binding protein YcfA (HicA-like mRNA interferase family)
MKIRDIIRLIEAEGWYLVETKGSHRQYKHPRIPAELQLLDIQTMIWVQAH